MKSMGDGNVLRQRRRDGGGVPALCAQPAHAGGDHGLRVDGDTGPGDPPAQTYKKLGPVEVSALPSKTREAAHTGKYEPFKTTSTFDGTAHNPQWLG
jgi:hypothetical protein